MAPFKLEAGADTLWEKCYSTTRTSASGLTKIFTMDELLNLGVVSTPTEIMPLIQGLLDSQLLRLMTLDGQLCYAIRPRDDAVKLASLDEAEIMVYQQIENSGTNGIWSKNIKHRTNIHQTTINKSITKLESKKLIKQIKSIKFPHQKIYMLSHLEANEDVTGGPWFSDGELDVELIAVTADAVVHFIERQSWKTVNVKRERSLSPLSIDDPTVASNTTNKKRKRNDIDIEGPHPKSRKQANSGEPTQISYPAGYRHYPTVHSIRHFIQESGFLKNAADLEISDLQSLLDVLVFDDRIEKIGGGYRTVRGVFGATEAMKNLMVGRSVADAVEEGDAGNGLSQAPCGKCPVFALCEEGGPVNAGNCEYFAAWLRT